MAMYLTGSFPNRSGNICSGHPLPSKSSREVTKEQTANLYHRNFTSAGYSASSVEKYHYHSDCHRRIRCSLTLLPGILARSVSEVLAYPIRWLIIRTKVRCAYIFSCQGTVKELLLIGVKNNPFTCSDWERSNYRVFLKNSLKNFFELGK